MANASCMKTIPGEPDNVKILSTTEEASTKISTTPRWLGAGNGQRGRVRVRLPGHLPLRGRPVLHPRQPEGRAVRRVRAEREQQRQESAVRHVLRVVPHQGRQSFQPSVLVCYLELQEEKEEEMELWIFVLNFQVSSFHCHHISCACFYFTQFVIQLVCVTLISILYCNAIFYIFLCIGILATIVFNEIAAFVLYLYVCWNL